MPRNSRQDTISDSKIYHIILKGINGQEIFFEDSDRIKFLEQLRNTKIVYEYDIYAYVLMSNHVHLIIWDKEDKISQIIHRTCTIYAMYFNRKYERKGHLFQNRFRSKSVDTAHYLLNLQRYIHRNPQKDGIDKVDRYKWSSYQEYVNTSKITNITYVLDMFDKDRNVAIQKFVQYNKMNDSEYGIEEFELRESLTDEEAIEKIKKILNISNIMEILNLRKELRNKYIAKIYNIKEISQKQISRILGMSIRTIQRAIKEIK